MSTDRNGKLLRAVFSVSLKVRQLSQGWAGTESFLAGKHDSDF